jgi:hypothetical protein
LNSLLLLVGDRKSFFGRLREYAIAKQTARPARTKKPLKAEKNLQRLGMDSLGTNPCKVCMVEFPED